MITAASREVQDHDTLLRVTGAIAAALGALWLIALPAQPAAAQGAVPCTAIENDAERLACYDRALRPAPAPAAQRPAAATEVAPQNERPVRASAAPVAPTPPAAPAAGRSGADRNSDGIVPIVIVGVRTLQGRETTFTAEDGTRWVQTDSQQLVGLPDAPFEAELKPGAMGSRFLQPKNHPRAIRVRPGSR